MDATVKFLTTLAGIVEGISLDDALRIIELSEHYRANTPDPLTTHLGRMQFGRELDTVVDSIKSLRKIVAIRDLRNALQAKGQNPTLKEVKDVVEALTPEFPAYPWATAAY